MAPAGLEDGPTGAAGCKGTTTSHPAARLAAMPDLTPEHLEQLARSLTMSGALGDADRLAIVEVLREVAARRRREARSTA